MGGYYDPYMIDPRLHNLQELPPLDIEECQYVECAGRKGTFHSEEVEVIFNGKKTKAAEKHHRMSDSTHNPLIEKHKTCTPIPSAGYLVRVDGFAKFYRPEDITVVSRSHSVEEKQSVQSVEPPISKPAVQSIEVLPERKLVRNNFTNEGETVRVRDGVKIVARLEPSQEKDDLQVGPESKIWFEAFLQNKKTQKWGWTVIQEGVGVYELPAHSGWEFANPKNRPTT